MASEIELSMARILLIQKQKRLKIAVIDLNFVGAVMIVPQRD
jgi:hypothetical protein